MEKNKYERALLLSDRQFKLLVGVSKETSSIMIEVLREAYIKKHKRRGRHSKLSIELMLMMSLEYWRQYSTFFELGFEYGVAESTSHDIIVWVENTLIKCGRFSLPGKKVLIEDNEIEIILVDVTESPVERPKKTKTMVFRQKEETHHKNTNLCKQKNL